MPEIFPVQETAAPSSTSPERRQCKATSKRTGGQCSAWAVQGSELCFMHGEQGDAARRQGAAASVEARRNKVEERKRRGIDVIRERAERRAADFARIREAIADDPNAEPAVRLRAIESLENRAWGRPEPREQQPQEQPVDVLALARAKLAARSSG